MIKKCYRKTSRLKKESIKSSQSLLLKSTSPIFILNLPNGGEETAKKIDGP